MESPVASARIIRFGVFEVDLKACELRKHGFRIKLAEQPFQVLAMLLEHPGETVTREELRARLWQGDTFVDFDHGLNNAVMRVREVLLDSSDQPRYIETVPRRGYRFVAPVEELALHTASHEPVSSASTPALHEPEVAVASSTPAPTRATRTWSVRRRDWIVAAGAVVVVLALAAWFARYRSGAHPGNPTSSTSLVVLPLENLSGDKEQDYFADGMTDELIAASRYSPSS